MRSMNPYTTKEIEIYWWWEENRHEGLAEFREYPDGEKMIVFSADATGVAFDSCQPEDCDEGITLEDVWEDLEAQTDEDGKLDVTDIQLV